ARRTMPRVGLTDRFREAAEAARARLATHGVIADADAIHGIPPMPPQEADLAAAERARALGAPDPYSLITHDEVVALTGIPVGGPTLTYADDDIGVRFEAEDGHRRVWSFGVHAGHALAERTPFDPVGAFEWLVDLVDGAEPVPGLGDAAVYGRGMLYVRGGGRAFYVLIDAPEGSPAELWATRIARRVLERLADGEVA